ncbi:MAG: hypothetical protein U0T82_00095 [Bacteroidales bacterium]
MPKLLSFSLLGLFLLLHSCVKEEFSSSRYDGSLNLKTGLATPIGYSHVSMGKYLSDAQANNELRTDESGFLSLYYSASVFSATAGDLLSLTPISQSFSIVNHSGTTIDLQVPGSNMTLSDTILIPLALNLNAESIDSIRLSSGTLVMNTTSSGSSGTVTLYYPGILRNGIPLSYAHDLNSAAENQSLDQCVLVPEKGAGDNYYLRCILTVILTAPTGPVPDGSELFGLTIGFNTPVFETLYGNFSNLTIDLPPIALTPGIFSQFLDGHFDFKEPEFKLLFSNSFGIPIGISLSRFDVTDRYGQSIALTGSGIPGPGAPDIIDYPSLSQEGEIITDSILFNNENSNLPVLLESNPNALDVSASAEVDSIQGGVTGFIRSDSRLDIVAALDLPLWGKAEFLIVQDTLAFDYMSNSLPAPEEIERAIIRISSTNGFPVTVYPQAYFLDGNGMLLDSLFEDPQQLQGAGDNNGDGKADPLKNAPLDIDLPRDKIDILEATRYIITRGKVTTTNYPDEDVKFYADYFLDYNIGLIVQLKINTAK